MNSFRKLYKVLCLCFVSLTVILNISLPVYAGVYTEHSDGGDADTVYVAGNPNAYPLEYYSKEEKAFCGLFPDILNAVSEKTNISFTYISASDKNRQKELSRNNQVEIVTALTTDQNECKVNEMLPILEVSSKGKNKTYCMGFTEIASPELIVKVKNAFSEISEQEKAGYLIASTRNNPEVNSKNRLIKITAFSSAAVFIVICGILIIIAVKRKKHSNQNSMIDELTGIGNTEYYIYAFDRLISRQSKNLYTVVYLACETDKIGNEYGEKANENIDRYAAAYLNAQTASAEYLARMKSGVFILLIQSPTQQECLQRATAVVSGLNSYIQEFYPDLSNVYKAGVSRLCEHPDCNSETACYNAKQGYIQALRKGVSVKITDESCLAQNKKHDKLLMSIQKAVNNGEFRVYLQMITENQTGKICGAEMLSRWQNTEYGTLRPHEYIDILKETGLIMTHDYNMFASACRQLEEWSNEPYNSLFLTCNFTRISLGHTDFFDRISEISSGYKFDRSRLVIEITEDSISENSKTVSENIGKCRKAGFKIAIDDMGTGYSSFSDLYGNEIDLVKIGGEFISECTTLKQENMLSDIIKLVHNSGAKIICEGVENYAQAEFIDKINCDMMQGFYFSKILPLVECENFLNKEKIIEKSFF